MKTETTINISQKRMNMLIIKSKKRGIPLSKTIQKLIILKSRKIKSETKRFSAVKYQKNSGECWHKLHISLSPECYDCCIRLRAILKISVSAFISQAIDEFLNEISQESKTADNYSIYFRELIQKTENHIKIINEITTKIQKHAQLRI